MNTHGLALKIYVVYANPTDYPDKHVVRIHRVAKGLTIIDPEPLAVVDTLDSARAVIPPHLFRMGRYEEDDPVIVETWF